MTDKMENLIDEAILLADSRTDYDAPMFAEMQKRRAILCRNPAAIFIWESALTKMELIDIILPPPRSASTAISDEMMTQR